MLQPAKQSLKKSKINNPYTTESTSLLWAYTRSEAIIGLEGTQPQT